MGTMQQSLAKRKPGAKPDIGITVRRLGMEFSDDIPEFWFDNDPFMTLFMTALSCAFPDGERQFIQSVRNFRDQIQDPELLRQVRAFIGQEAHHGNEHDALNDMMRRKGYSVDRIYKRFKKMDRFLQGSRSPEYQLAATVCMEHITAILADHMLRISPADLELIDERVRKIWIWHAIEEAEHKAVAFDVYRTTVGRPWFLRRVMLETTFFFLLITGHGTIEFLRESGQMRNLKTWRRGASYLLGRRGIFRSVSGLNLDFFRKDFHPWQHDNGEVVKRFRREYLGEES